ncbi:MAG TPA: peptide ABC transporter substrate-binding protein [Gemmatimonadaceae bacterium]|nr:peptide ABC transporter substrate-binding protein [Gemmatimonadaceae bacterium]
MRESIGPRICVLVACALGAAACGSPTTKSDDTSAVGGSIVIAAQNEPRTLLPPVITQIDEKIIADQIFEPLAWLGDEGHLDRDYRPGLADSWSWERDSTAIVFHLNPNARWQDGTPVRASDVRFTFGLYTDSIVGFKDRSSLARIDSVTARDSVTAVFWFRNRYPEQFYDAATRLLIVPEHLLAREPRATLLTSAFGRQPIGSGRFRLGKWTPNASIELVADTANYHGRPKLDRVVFAVTTDQTALPTRLTTGEIDLAEVSTPAMFRTLKDQPDLRARMNPAYDYSFLLFNARQPKQRQQPNALFADIGLRRAISMGIDRGKLVRSQFDSLAVVSTGPMTRAQPLADSTIATIAYDPAGAARLLDSLGWTLPAGKTVRERRGQALKFSVLVPTVSANRMAMIVVIQESLRKLGVEVVVDAVDGNTFLARLAARNFDVVFHGMHVDPTVAGLRASWTVASARDANGLNFGNYENPRFDAHLDSALAARDLASARPHAKQAYETIVADAPAVWLYETRTAMLMHKRLRPAHLVSTAWWAGLADWSIPPAERLPRDRVGLRVASR